jgi:MoxR-like ATPase
MAEYRITAGGRTYPLDLPFLVFATQNPIEQEGTYPLPEAQLDRFMFLVDVGYPTAEEEFRIVQMTTAGAPPPLTKVLSPQDIQTLQEVVRRVPVPDHVVKHAVELVRATRPKEPGAFDFVQRYVSWGAGPRASQNLIVGAKARAILQGRYAASVEDVRALALSVLRHRIVANFTAESEGITPSKLVSLVLDRVKA